MRGKILEHHPSDAWLVFAGVAHLAILLSTIYTFGRISMGWSVAAVALLVYLHVFNLYCFSHNFVHNPFFVSRGLNRAFSIMNSVAVGFPMEAYYIVHANHHALNNDIPIEPGLTRDKFSIYRYGKEGKAESFCWYILAAHFRLDGSDLWRKLGRTGGRTRSLVEWGAIATGLVLVLALNWQGALFVLIPVHVLGWTINYAESYLEHYGAKTGVREANAVSCYSWLYNVLWFNNGYHMEHHYRPKAHWTRMPQLREQFSPKFREAGYRVIRGAHLFGLFQSPRAPAKTQAECQPAVDSNRQTISHVAQDEAI